MINAKVAGNGLTLVFLHGFGEDHSLWDELTLNLNNHYKTIAIDLPGFGKSAKIQSAFTLETIADKIYTYLISDQKTQKFVLFGHSLGGYVTLALAKKYAESVVGFALINSTALADSEVKKENRVKTSAFIQKHGAQYFLKSFVPNLFAAKNTARLTDKIDRVIAMGKSIDAAVLVSYMEAMKNRPDQLALLSYFQHVLFVGGSDDAQFSQADYNRQIAHLRDQNNGLILQDVGHMSMYEAPKLLLIAINNFLDSIKNV